MENPSRRAILAGLAAAIAPVPVIAATPRNPDAHIPALVRQHREVFEAANAADSAAADDEALMDRYFACRRAVLDARPMTLEGVLQKAQIARFEVRDECVLQSIVNDLLRLNGGAA